MTVPTAQAGVVDPFAPVPVTGGGGLPGARHLEGRVVIIQPVRVDETTLAFNKKDSAPTVIADIIVVDGGDLVYGDQVNNSGQQLKPPTHRVSTPCVFRGWMDSHAYIVNPCRDMLRAGQPVTVGIIERGTQGNKPYFLTETHTDVDRKPRPAGHEQRRQRAIDLWNALQTGQWTPPTPVELNPTPVARVEPGQWGGSFGGQTVSQATAWAQSPGAAPLASPAAQPLGVAPGWGTPAAPVTPPSPPVRDLSTPVPGLEAHWAQGTEQQRRDAWRVYDEQHPQQVAQVAAPAATPWG